MGRLGSDHIISPRKKAGRWAKEDVDPHDMGWYESVVLSIRRVSESIGKSSHVVECKATSLSMKPIPTRQKQFSSEAPDDPDGKAGALRFALTTAALPAFRSFLFGTSGVSSNHGLLDGVANASTSARVDASRDVGISNSKVTAYLSVRRNTVFGLWFTAAICRFEYGSLCSISFRNLSKKVEAGMGRVVAFFCSTSFKSWVYRFANRTLPCGGEAGVCRQNGGTTAKCKQCGGLEHPECHSQTFSPDQQAQEEYVCSTCLLLEREEILAIRLEEQVSLGHVRQLQDVFI